MIYLDNIIFALQKHGGVSVLWYELIEQLKLDGILFHCLEYPQQQFNSVRMGLDIPVENIEMRISQLIKIARYVNPYVSINVPFVFHSSHYRICSNKRSLNVTTVHDFTYEYFRSGISKQIHCWQKYQAIRKADAIVCISENTKQDLMKFLPDVDEKKISIIYNGVSNDYHVMNDKVKEYEDCILFVGSRQDYKNFEFVVDTIVNTPFRLLICGGVLLEKEKNFIEAKLGSERYIHVCHPSNQQLNRIYNSVYCLAYPSSYEGFGIPVIEAQRTGCPVIAFNCSSIPEIIGETPLLINHLSQKDFSNALKLIDSAQQREEIIRNGLANSQRFSWTKMAQEYESLYSYLLKE